MSIIGFIPDPEQAAKVVSWAQALAETDEGMEFLCYEIGFDGRTEQAVRVALEKTGAEAETVTMVREETPVAEVLQRVRKARPQWLVTGSFEFPEVAGKAQTSDELVRSSPCRTLIPIYGEKGPAEIKKILFVATGRAQDQTALHIVDKLRRRQRAQVTIGMVEEETGAKAGKVGQQTIQSLLHDAALDEEEFEIKVVVDRLKHRGIKKLFGDHDLVVVGVDVAGHISPLRHSLGKASVAIVKRIPPLRFGAWPDWLPRINPADHAGLLHDLHRGSIWGSDFVVMLALASAIASLGLLQNSPAVVIGSMLLAPLMTPMMGVGLALQQANFELIRLCGKSIGLGFLLTLGVSFLIGFITPSGQTLSEEVLSRGGPNVLDLLIALFAAAAAAYAMARPRIVGAVAGVAIATALVPPACSVGVSLAFGAYLNAAGAAVLFLSNLVAIVLASSFMFSLLGITAARVLPRKRRLVQAGRLALLLVLVGGLGGPLTGKLLSQIGAGKNVTPGYPVTTAVSNALYERVRQDEGVAIMLLARPRSWRGVLIHIASEKELPQSYADELRAIVREKMKNPKLPVTVIVVRGWWHSSDEFPLNVSPLPSREE